MEMSKGYWLSLKGPPGIAFSGICEQDSTNLQIPQMSDASTSELWFSMMCAGGYEEGKFAQLMSKCNENYDENGEACDEFN